MLTPQQRDDMNNRPYLIGVFSMLLAWFAVSSINAADIAPVRPSDQSIIYFSSAPWDGAAYAIEIPLEHGDDSVQPVICIDIWGYPEFSEPKTFNFTGREDPGGGPSRGDGRAFFQANRNKTMPYTLMGSVSFKKLQNGHPVSGSYEFMTLDGKRKFKGTFQAAWGNDSPKIIR
jgi:hypothetical protein